LPLPSAIVLRKAFKDKWEDLNNGTSVFSQFWDGKARRKNLQPGVTEF